MFDLKNMMNKKIIQKKRTINTNKKVAYHFNLKPHY